MISKIGLVTDIAFWQIGNGQNTRILELYTFLSHHSQLTLYYLGEEPLQLRGRSIQKENQRAQLALFLEEAHHDLVIVEYLHLDWIADLKLKDTLVYLDAHDLISERTKAFKRFNRASENFSFEEEIERFDKFDKVMFLQKEEMRQVLPFLGEDRLLLCPHPVVPTQEVQIRDQVEVIGFLAGPSWPNIDGIQWFHDLVLPYLKDLAAKCIVHGSIVHSPFSVFTPELPKGQLFSSIDLYYNQIDIAINPVLYGSGLKIKTIEALAYGIPLVTTSIGAQGLIEESGHSFILADTPQEFADAILTLASSFTLRRQLSLCAKKFARHHFTHEACFASLLA